MNIRPLQNHTPLLALFVLFCALSFGQSSTSYGEPSFKIDLGIAEVMRELRSWWDDVLTRNDQIKDEQTRKSARTLAVAYLEMAGLMETFSNELDNFYNEKSMDDPACPPLGGCRAASASLANLEVISNSMQTTLGKMQNTIGRLDEQWAVANIDVSTDVFANVPRRGVAVNETSRLVVRMKNQKHEVTEEEARAISQKLRGLARQARLIASEIASTLND
jgi:hypothetical protein